MYCSGLMIEYITFVNLCVSICEHLSLKLNDWLNYGSLVKGLAQFQLKEGYGGNTILGPWIDCNFIVDGAIREEQCDSWDSHGNQQ